MNRTLRTSLLAASLLSGAAFAQKPPAPPAPPSPVAAPVPPAPPAPPPVPGMSVSHYSMTGLPPQAAQRAGISTETQKKVRDATFEANEALIPLEADLKRAQLELEKALANATPDEATVMNKLELVNRAELSVRKNRMSLLVRIRKLVGPEAWDRLQAEMPVEGPGMMMLMAPPGGKNVRREVRIIRGDDGSEQVDVRGE